MTQGNPVVNNQKRFNLKTLKATLDSEGYKKDLKEMSRYAASIKQERPMLYILAKHLDNRRFNVILEKKIKRRPYDLVVDNTKIEAKFYYEGDLKRRLEKEMEDVGWSIEPLIKKLESLKKEKKGTSWNMALAIVKDITEKVEKAKGIFMLIILSRDLREIKRTKPELLEQICWSKYEIEYNEKSSGGYNNPENLKLASRFLDQIKKTKPFERDYLKIEIDPKTDIDAMFRSSYHIYLCDFISA